MALHKPDIPVGVAKAESIGRLGPVTWANVMYFAVGTFDPAHLEDVVTMVGIECRNFYVVGITMNFFTPDWHYSRTKVTFRDATDSHYRSVYVLDAVGTQAAETEAGQVCLLINYTTNDPRRGGKARTYVAGVNDENMADAATLSTAMQSSVNASLQTWFNSLSGASSGTASSLELLEMSFRNGGTWRDTAASWPVRAVALNPVIATQRRRVDRLR